MQKFTKKSEGAVIDYYVAGTKPKLLITSGVHGDEFQVVGSVRKAVEKYLSRLPDFIYIPVLCPSGFALKTRRNARGKDANRVYTDDTNDFEAKLAMEIVNGHDFEVHFDFHEDIALYDFYLYDTPQYLPVEKLTALFAELKTLNIDLWEGIDDPNDPVLANLVVNGLTSFGLDHSDGSLESWLRFSGHTKESVVPEIPGQALQETKDKIVDAIFRNLLVVR